MFISLRNSVANIFANNKNKNRRMVFYQIINIEESKYYNQILSF